MARYLIERFVSNGGRQDPTAAVRLLRGAAEAMRGEGIDVLLVRSLYVPGDEICFHELDGPSGAAVAEAGRRADLRFERVSEAVELVIPHERPATTRRESSAHSRRAGSATNSDRTVRSNQQEEER